MSKLIKLLIFASLFFLTGCVPSLHTIATEKNTIFDQQLLGLWTEGGGDDDQSWTFTKDGEKGYLLEIKEEDEKSQFQVKLVKIKKLRFLDIFPVELESNETEFYMLHLVAAHTFILVDCDGKELKMKFMNPNEIKKILKKDPKALKHEIIEDRLVLTASTKKLRRFLIKQSKNEELFGKAEPLIKKIIPEKPKKKIDNQTKTI